MSRVLNGMVIALGCFFAVVVAYPFLSGQPLDAGQDPSAPAGKAAKEPPAGKAGPISGSKQLTSPPTGVGYAGDPCPDDGEEKEEECREAKPAACKGKRKQCERDRDGRERGKGG